MNTPIAKKSSTSVSILIALALPFVAAGIGGFATSRSVSTWYTRLRKPSWNPPAWIFGPVWTVLYATMGIASWLVWRKGESATGRLSRRVGRGHPRVRRALRLYGVHLVFNTLWSILFFGMRRVDLALGEIVVLWSLILATVVSFFRIDRRAGWLLVPYQLWATFATVLNFTIWRLNRQRSDV